VIDMADGFALDPADLVLLFADLQPGIVQNSGTNPPELIEAGAAALAEAADVLGAPKLFSVVPEDGGPATHLSALEDHATEANSFTRHAASPFMDPHFTAALEATGRRTLVISGYSIEAVVLFASLDAISAGYRVVVAIDACGARSARAEDAVLRRIERAGATIGSVIGVVMGCAPDFTSPEGEQAFPIVHRFMATRA
jgi:nicotinamidase-related amidase